jgi:glutaredoxin 3
MPRERTSVRAAVKIYTTDYCGYCVRAKQLLERKGARYEEIDVTNRPDLRKWLMAAANQRTVPQIFINGRPQGGFVDIAWSAKASSTSSSPPSQASTIPR